MVVDVAGAPHFRVLGPVQVLGSCGEPVDLPPGRQSTVLAVLLLNAGEVVSADQLVDTVWPWSPPATARTQVQICISELRKKLAAAGHDGVLRTRRPGYVMELGGGDVDHRLFDALVLRSQRLEQDPVTLAAAADELRSALALWRGAPIEGVEAEGLASHVSLLEERRTSAFESFVDIRLRLGEHGAMVSDLMLATERHPLRERPYAQLMTALFRSGRRADALAVYQDVRRRLVDQLGIEPGPELRAVHEHVLAGAEDDRLTAPVDNLPVPVPLPVHGAGAPTSARPFQLPAAAADFGGRDEDCARLVRALTEPVERLATPVAVLAGKPGVGKSALAVHVAHTVRESFPDGQLYCDLGGSSARPAEVGEVLARFARALGASGSAIPDGEVERGELFRTLIAGRRMLVVLEDAASEQQVRALLPGEASSAVLVTSRTLLTGLPGAVVHHLDVLDQVRARQLLARVVGAERVDAEPEAADALVRMVGGLPLALRIVAARLAARSAWPLSVMMERLEDERHRLDELTHGEMMMRASLAMSYDGLHREAARLLRLLSTIDMCSYPVWVAAALLDTEESVAARLLDLLVDVHLLEVAALDLDGGPRYRFHVIIRLFAQEQVGRMEGAEGLRGALSRVGGGWLALVEEVHRRIHGGDYVTVRSGARRRPLEARRVRRLLADPLRWLESERANVCAFIARAAEPAMVETCWELAVTMVDLFESGSYFDDWAATHDVALRAAEQSGDRRGEAAVLASLGTLHLTRGCLDEAMVALERAREGFEAIGEQAGLALVQRDLAWSAQLAGDTAAAVAGYRAALAAFELVGDPIGQAHVLGRLADVEHAAGEPDTALRRLRQALQLCRDAGNDRVEIQTLFRISSVAMRENRLDEAESQLPDLLERVRAGHDVIGEAKILQQLGSIRLRRGDAAAALEYLNEALDVRNGSVDQAGIDGLLAELGAARCALP